MDAQLIGPVSWERRAPQIPIISPDNVDACPLSSGAQLLNLLHVKMERPNPLSSEIIRAEHSSQEMSAFELQIIAVDWIARFDASDHPENVWLGFRAWMNEHPARRAAVRRAEAQWRIMHAVIQSLAPGISRDDRRAACEKFEAELRAYPAV